MPRVRVRSLDTNPGECTNVTVVEQLRIAVLRFADQQKKIFGHDHVFHDDELVSLPCLLHQLVTRVLPLRKSTRLAPLR